MAAPLWDALLAAGEEHGMLPCGLGARDTLRTEMGYPLHGQDISLDVTPNQARLGWAVGWSKREGEVPLGVGAQGIANTGLPVQVFVSPRSDDEMRLAKERSAAGIEKAEHLYLRPQHLMCIACYYGTEQDEPLAVDNLYEIRVKMERQPDIPVTITEGNCMVCDPCPLLDTGRNVCLGTHVRDPLRDLMILRKLGLRPGDTLPARELYRLLFSRIPTAAEICGWGDMRNVTNEWRICTDVNTGRYENAIKRNMLGAAPESSSRT